jgi:hypothetical protein
MGAIFLWCSDMFLIWQAFVKLCECHVGSSRLFWDDFGWFRHWAFSCSLPCRSMETGNVGSWGLNDKIRCIDHTYFSNWCRYKKDRNRLTCPTKHMYYHIIIYMCVLREVACRIQIQIRNFEESIISTLYPHYIHIRSTLTLTNLRRGGESVGRRPLWRCQVLAFWICRFVASRLMLTYSKVVLRRWTHEKLIKP